LPRKDPSKLNPPSARINPRALHFRENTSGSFSSTFVSLKPPEEVSTKEKGGLYSSVSQINNDQVKKLESDIKRKTEVRYTFLLYSLDAQTITD
jgi:hypothetical protein